MAFMLRGEGGRACSRGGSGSPRVRGHTQVSSRALAANKLGLVFLEKGGQKLAGASGNAEHKIEPHPDAKKGAVRGFPRRR